MLGHGFYTGPAAYPRAAATTDQLHRIVAAVSATGGHTEHLPTSQVPTSGYMVSLADHERTVPLSAFTYTWLARYVRDHAAKLRDSQHFLGLWVAGWGEANAERTVYADVSTRFDSVARARVAGRLAGQLAIYDVAASEVIEL